MNNRSVKHAELDMRMEIFSGAYGRVTEIRWRCPARRPHVAEVGPHYVISLGEASLRLPKSQGVALARAITRTLPREAGA